VDRQGGVKPTSALFDVVGVVKHREIPTRTSSQNTVKERDKDEETADQGNKPKINLAQCAK